MIQTSLTFPIHAYERTAQGTAYVQENAERLSNGCRKLIQYFQTHSNIPITNKIARELKISSYCSARIADLRKSGIIVLDKTIEEDGNKVKAFWLGCMCEEPRRNTAGCLIHSEKLKV